MTKIKEIFASIQGEGPFVGYKQLFIRLCGCNLNCKYCDTDFDAQTAKDYTIEELQKIISQNNDCHSISLTGGEPLLNIEFIKSLAEVSPKGIYLETNGTLPEKLEEVIDLIKYVSADIKLPSCTGGYPLWEVHDKFFEIASKKHLFLKVVFDSSITDDEINHICALSNKYNLELILQPMMIKNELSVNSNFMQCVLDKCLKLNRQTRLIPQVHKFLDVM